MVAAVQLFGLALERPWGALALLAPALVWLLAARGGRPLEAWTGTLALWREVAEGPRTQEPRTRRLPPAVRLLVAALVAAALALTGPHAARAAAGRTWTVVVDRSPSMLLPWLAPPAEPARALTRLGRAVERAQELLAEVRERADRVVWLTYADGRPRRIESVTFPPAWLAAPDVPQAEPPWSAHDVPGTIWLTDAEPPTPAREAGLALSGGGAVPGFVAALGTTRVEWDGAGLVERADAGARPAVLLGAGGGGPLERVVRAWAAARQCDIVTDRGAPVVLELAQARSPGGGGRRGSELTVGRDGWAWEVVLPRTLPRTPGEAWLASADGDPVVVWQAGRVTLVPADGSREPSGDPADFALSWAELLDRAALPPAGVVPLVERRGAGAGLSRRRGAPLRGAAPGADHPAALLSVLAAALALAALATRRR